MHAQDLCEFLIPQRKGLFEALYDRVINEYGINMAWMACVSPDRYGKAWAQLAYNRICKADAPYGPQDYLSAGVTLSIYNVNDDDSMNAVLPYYPRLKAIFTNYPAMLIQKLKDQGYVQ
jgi:glycerophosphoryl diester phosphodiesterase